MANLERQYTIPLRRETLKVPKYRRAKKAVKAIREFLARHMKTDFEKVKLGRWLNELVWERGIKNPPNKVRVNVSKDDKGIATAELIELSERSKKIDAKDQARMKVIDEKKKKEDDEKKAQEEAQKKAAEEEKKKQEAAKTEAEKEVDKEKKDIEKVEKQVVDTPKTPKTAAPKAKSAPKHPVRKAMQK
ncbi:50S ribosomal protein L31e [Nanoarchaeota archaeon]